MSRAAIVVLARMGSRRLPGKTLCDLGGKQLIARVLDRVALAACADPVILATSDETRDDPIAGGAKNAGVALFRGSHDDVLGRLIACSDAFNLDRFVRISGDSPLVPPDLIDLCVARHDSTGADIVTNVHPRSFPPGASVEVVTVDALRRIADATNAPADREHVTRYAYTNDGDFSIENIAAEQNYDGISLAVDTEADLARARAIVADLGPAPERASLEAVVALTRAYDQRQRSTAA